MRSVIDDFGFGDRGKMEGWLERDLRHRLELKG